MSAAGNSSPVHATTFNHFRPKYRLESAERGDCTAFRRNALRYCFNAEDERMQIAEQLRRTAQITGIEYAVRLAESNARREKYRAMLRHHLTFDEMKELVLELPEYTGKD